ncbi:MAG: hypothetical protein ACJAY2_000930 [Pseudomonadales bacterium]
MFKLPDLFVAELLNLMRLLADLRPEWATQVLWLAL